MMKRIFAVEDDDNIRELILYALSSAGFEGRGFTESRTLYPALDAAAPDLILLDIMLPGEDGITILKRLKASAKTGKIPVIMLTAKEAEYDRIKGLDSGADDYITKPFSVMEVIARIRAVLRRSAPDNEAVRDIGMGGLLLSPDKRSVRADGDEIVLTYREFELLHYLMLNQGIVLNRDTLLNQVWGMDYPGESRTVDMHIKSLRKKLGDRGRLIKTVRNVGYKIEDT
jgi:two-component system alkaline phosphatase synthesis response regulator PhoP